MAPLTSPFLKKISHGFFTKDYPIKKDEIINLQKNEITETSKLTSYSLAKVTNYFDVNIKDLIFLNQSHSSKCITYTNYQRNRATNGTPLFFDGDAVISDVEGKVLCVITADCAPILIADNQKKIFGAIHSGWRGAVNDVLENTIDAFQSLGSNPANITAVIGPMISNEVYEVKDDFVSLFITKDETYSRFFKKGKNVTFDFPNFLAYKLRKLGIKKLSFMEKCTLKENKRFFSHRRSTIKGILEINRQISAIKVEN